MNAMQMARKKHKAVIDLESSEECDAGKFDGLYDSESDLHIDVDNLSDVCYFLFSDSSILLLCSTFCITFTFFSA